jgi:uncharacterized membrane protein
MPVVRSTAARADGRAVEHGWFRCESQSAGDGYGRQRSTTMRMLRILVLASSTLQVAIGSYAVYRLLQEASPDLLGILLCCAVIIVGLASCAGMFTKLRPSLSRVATAKINLVVLLLVAIGAAAMYAFKQHQGATDEQLQFVAMISCVCAAPFLVNSVALSLIERRVRKVTEKYMRRVA